MRNIAFVIWMLGFPSVAALDKYLNHLSRAPNVTDDVAFLSSAVVLAMWAGVAWLLYERERP